MIDNETFAYVPSHGNFNYRKSNNHDLYSFNSEIIVKLRGQNEEEMWIDKKK